MNHAAHLAIAFAIAVLLGVLDGLAHHRTHPRTKQHADGSWSVNSFWVVRSVLLVAGSLAQGVLAYKVTDEFNVTYFALMGAMGLIEYILLAPLITRHNRRRVNPA